jgi:hypothetical protein
MDFCERQTIIKGRTNYFTFSAALEQAFCQAEDLYWSRNIGPTGIKGSPNELIRKNKRY